MFSALGCRFISPNAGPLISNLRQRRGLEPDQGDHFALELRRGNQLHASLRPSSAPLRKYLGVEAEREAVFGNLRMVLAVRGPPGEDIRPHPCQDFRALTGCTPREVVRKMPGQSPRFRWLNI